MSSISIVVPIYNEAENIGPLAKEIQAAMHSQPSTWECIWVNDGSTDDSLAVLRTLSKEDERHRYLSLSQNFGQSAALWAGFRESRGEIIATLDGDGQNDPSDLPALIALVEEGATDMANGYRAKRHDTFLKRMASRVANQIRNAIVGKTVRDVGCSTRAFRRECLELLTPFRGMHRFLPNLIQIQGYRFSEQPVNHRPRKHGRSKYTIRNRLWVGLLDTFGMWWLQHRHFRLVIQERSWGD
jgi:dolichol-phosphate mannosyltransferase